jgi:elongation factor P
MISVTELRKGTVFAEGGKPYLVVDYRHIKVGRGAANIKVKVKDLKSGSTLEKSFMSGASVEEAEVVRKKAQYLYSDDKNLYFMDPQTFEQFGVSKTIAQDTAKFLKEGAETVLLMFQNEPIAIELPLKVDLKVVETPPGEKGDTKQGGSKEATLETGYSLQVPLFIKNGDILRINTETGEYVERAA